jgi:hypothetical protein
VSDHRQDLSFFTRDRQTGFFSGLKMNEYQTQVWMLWRREEFAPLLGIDPGSPLI